MFGNCSASQKIEIICPCSLWLPNIFSPNNDGFNDEYIPQITFELHSFSMTIFNRWGNIIYQTDEFISWNGKNKYGRDASAGVYYCVVEYSCKDNPNKKRTAQGSITLVR
jgi:gliding motility-associated-like protein